mmetsp:Transcript_19169/g.25175  ORF Transcript_19169/g.25175 Transcript_19169/m.25175 type:complete len:207 (+) Transcript_19169:277-897(+)
MITLAFFFLLRPGEYTGTHNDDTPFRLADVQLFIGPRRLDLLTASDADLEAAQGVSLTFTTQKNGVRGEVVHHGLSGHPILCPVRAMTRRVQHLRAHNAPTHTILAWLIFKRGFGHHPPPGSLEKRRHVALSSPPGSTRNARFRSPHVDRWRLHLSSQPSHCTHLRSCSLTFTSFHFISIPFPPSTPFHLLSWPLEALAVWLDSIE